MFCHYLKMFVNDNKKWKVKDYDIIVQIFFILYKNIQLNKHKDH